MRITITIDTDNAAFEDVGAEVSRILSREAEYFAEYPMEVGESRSLLDQNGNRVGIITTEEG